MNTRILRVVEKTLLETGGAGDWGTAKLLKRYLKDTPFAKIIGYKIKNSKRKKMKKNHD